MLEIKTKLNEIEACKTGGRGWRKQSKQSLEITCQALYPYQCFKLYPRAAEGPRIAPHGVSSFPGGQQSIWQPHSHMLGSQDLLAEARWARHGWDQGVPSPPPQALCTRKVSLGTPASCSLQGLQPHYSSYVIFLLLLRIMIRWKCLHLEEQKAAVLNCRLNQSVIENTRKRVCLFVFWFASPNLIQANSCRCSHWVYVQKQEIKTTLWTWGWSTEVQPHARIQVYLLPFPGQHLNQCSSHYNSHKHFGWHTSNATHLLLCIYLTLQCHRSDTGFCWNSGNSLYNIYLQVIHRLSLQPFKRAFQDGWRHTEFSHLTT